MRSTHPSLDYLLVTGSNLRKAQDVGEREDHVGMRHVRCCEDGVECRKTTNKKRTTENPKLSDVDMNGRTLCAKTPHSLTNPARGGLTCKLRMRSEPACVPFGVVNILCSSRCGLGLHRTNDQIMN